MFASSPAKVAASGPPPQEPAPLKQQNPIFLSSFTTKLEHIWFSLQVSHNGKYSVERLLALEEYTRKTSITRILLVCFGTPLPMVAVVLLQECIPLQEPSDGWSVNYGFWIRAGVLGGVVAVGMAAFVIYMIPGIALSKLQLTLLFTGQAIGYPAIGMLVAALWVFPIPFMVLTIISLYVLLFAVLFRFIAGKQNFLQMAAYKDELVLLVSFSGSQSFMAVTYAAYSVLFDHVTKTHLELPVLLLLPVIKLIMKNFVSLTIKHMKDMVPEAVIFTVDFFNSMYLATCMQSTSSITTVATMMTLDFGQTAVSLRSLHQRSDTILSRLRTTCGVLILDNDGLLPVARKLCFDTDKFKQQNRRDVLLDSCLPHQLSQEGRNLLEILKTVPGNGQRTLPRMTEIGTSIRSTLEKSPTISKLLWGFSRRDITKIEPSSARNTKDKRPEPSRPAEKSMCVDNLSNQHRELLGETLEVLFMSECLLLTEYLESIIPVLYGNFILLVVNLPSAPYHMDLVGVNRDNVGATLLNVHVYALLEFASFVTLTLVMMRNCRMQALAHLAFVLETQMLLVQVKLMTWVLMTLSFRVVHFGADFTFQFQWMKRDV